VIDVGKRRGMLHSPGWRYGDFRGQFILECDEVMLLRE
jgi:hypothetical protein